MRFKPLYHSAERSTSSSQEAVPSVTEELDAVPQQQGSSIPAFDFDPTIQDNSFTLDPQAQPAALDPSMPYTPFDLLGEPLNHPGFWTDYTFEENNTFQ